MSPYERILAALEARGLRVHRKDRDAAAQCPAHDDRHESLTVTNADDGRALVHCHAGCAIEQVVAALGVQMKDLYPQGERGIVIPLDRRARLHTSGCSIEQYAEAKRLPVDFLRRLGISDYKDSRYDTPVLRIPYRDVEGSEPAVRMRLAAEKGNGDQRFIWRKGSKPCLYGLWRQCARVQPEREGGNPPPPYMVIVEGESDCHTLWHHQIPAVGLPGANSWQEQRDAQHFDGLERIYVVVEPDAGGRAVEGWLAKSRIRDRAWIVELGEHKDPSGLHLADPEHFLEQWAKALEKAEPWRERAAQVEDAERREVADQCARLALSPRILDQFAADLRALGIVGEERLAKLVYLAATSRLLDRIVSLGVKGPSAAGKSATVEHTLRFFPPSAFYVLTAMSERGLIFIDEGMAHRMLVVYEAEGMAGDLQTYLIRSLLSEGRIRYQMAGKGSGGEIVGRLVELEGPTGLIVTTTAISLHPENETRLLSVTATDTPAQTKAVLLAIAEDRDSEPDIQPWHALQRWLELGERRVTIPYAKQLAEEIPPLAVRLRRDFGQLLGLIRSHALLHQAQREQDEGRRIIATLDDYAVVRDLVVDLVSEGVQATVKPEVREAVEAVRKLAGEDGATRSQVAQELRLDPSAAGRRLAAAAKAGYLRNQGKGNRSSWVIGDPLPEDIEILPAPRQLRIPESDRDRTVAEMSDAEILTLFPGSRIEETA
jgi:hypothetical protein